MHNAVESASRKFDALATFYARQEGDLLETRTMDSRDHQTAQYPPIILSLPATLYLEG